MKQRTNISQLVKACQRGDTKAQRAIYDCFVDSLYYTVFRYLGDAFQAENILQDVFVKVFNKIDLYDSRKAKFITWASTIAIHESINFLKKKKFEFEQIDLHVFVLQDINMALSELGAEEILLQINKLPKLQRMIFNLYEVDGYSHVEISNILNIPANTSRSYLSRAKQSLKKAILTNSQYKINP